MRLFALSDLHLSGSVPTKSMDIFGENWSDHASKIAANWNAVVKEDDVVLVAGDISWAMTPEEAEADLMTVSSLPGRKVLLKGNHDFWWSSIGKLRRSLPSNMYVIQNDSVELDGIAIAGSRGWLCPSQNGLSDDDMKIYRREVMRLEMSLSSAKKTGLPMIGALHFPPFNEKKEPSDFTELFESYGVKTVVYGHLHGPGIRYAFEGELRGVNYILTSCDAVDFSPRLIAEF